MIYYIKFDIQTICKRIIQEQLNNAQLSYSLINANEIEIKQSFTADYLYALNNTLSQFGIEIIASQKITLIQKIKEAITDLVNQKDDIILSKTSQYLAKKLNCGYRYLSGIFSEVTYTTIENYIIIQKIEKAKEMIASGELTFTEIAWKLNYSSIGHFSTQFKNITGFTPTIFKKIITQKRERLTLDSSLLKLN